MRHYRYLATIMGVCLLLVSCGTSIKPCGAEYTVQPEGVVTASPESNTLGPIAPIQEPDDGMNEQMSEVNEVGNLAGNISYPGFAAVQGEWIYFLNEARSDSKPLGIFRLHQVSGELQKVTSNIGSYINVIGNWVYYCNASDENSQGMGLGPICRTSLDGTKTEKLNDYSCSGMLVAGEWIYYIKDKGSTLCKMKTDGSNQQELHSQACQSINVVGKSIYFVTGAEVFRMNTEGKDLYRIPGIKAGRMIVFREWIYYTDENYEKLYRSSLDGSGSIQLVDEHVTGFNIANDKLYFSLLVNGEDRIYEADSDGSGRQEIGKGNVGCIAGPWNYFYQSYEEYFSLLRLNLATGKTETVFKKWPD